MTDNINIKEDDLWAAIGKQNYLIGALRQQVEMQNGTIAKLLGENRELRDAQNLPTGGDGNRTGPRTINGPDGQVFEPIERAGTAQQLQEVLQRNGPCPTTLPGVEN